MPDPLGLEVRKNIYDVICKFPGIHMRELQRKTGLATGSLDYHLHFLYKSGLVRIEKSSGFTRYYSSLYAFTEEEKRIISVLRQETLRHIIIFLLQKKRANATVIAGACNLKPSNLSAYLKTLESNGLISYVKKGRFRVYTTNGKDAIIRCLVLHKKSFLDQMVDNFISAWIDE